jgi:hypothetical protein
VGGLTYHTFIKSSGSRADVDSVTVLARERESSLPSCKVVYNTLQETAVPLPPPPLLSLSGPWNLLLYFPYPVNIKYDSSYLQVNTKSKKFFEHLFDNNQE